MGPIDCLSFSVRTYFCYRAFYYFDCSKVKINTKIVSHLLCYFVLFKLEESD